VSTKIPAIAGGSPVRKQFLIFGSPAIGEEEIIEVTETLRSGWLGRGPKTERFEGEFQRYIGSKHAIAVNSCTSGLHLALDVLNIGNGDEVITSPLTFAATGNVIVHRGARPIFADVERDTLNIDCHQIVAKLTSKTKAIIPVHFAGRPCEMDNILAIASTNHLRIIGDAAHAIETAFEGRKVGNIGDITAFSFYVTKNICTGEGGMITTNSDEWADEMRIKSLHGLSRDAWKRYSADGFQPYETLFPGYKYNMTDMQASLGIHQLARVEENLKKREYLVNFYDKTFAELPGLIIRRRPLSPTARHAHHLYPILLDLERIRLTREEFITALKEENIGCGIHFTPLHLHSFYRKTFGYRQGDCPNAEWVGERTVSLPLSPALTMRDVSDVAEAVRRILRQFLR